MEKPNLLWEIIRFHPQILFTLEATKKLLRRSLCRDMSHFLYLLQSEFGISLKYAGFTECKSLLTSQLAGQLFYLTKNSNDRPEFVPQLKSFDCNTKQIQVYSVPQLTNLYHQKCNRPQFLQLDKNTLFVSGGMNPAGKVISDCYMFKISSNKLEFKRNMNKGRWNHGVQKMNQNIFAFGGGSQAGVTNSAEVYDVLKNEWKNLPNMPEQGSQIT